MGDDALAAAREERRAAFLAWKKRQAEAEAAGVDIGDGAAGGATKNPSSFAASSKVKNHSGKPEIAPGSASATSPTESGTEELFKGGARRCSSGVIGSPPSMLAKERREVAATNVIPSPEAAAAIVAEKERSSPTARRSPKKSKARDEAKRMEKVMAEIALAEEEERQRRLREDEELARRLEMELNGESAPPMQRPIDDAVDPATAAAIAEILNEDVEAGDELRRPDNTFQERLIPDPLSPSLAATSPTSTLLRPVAETIRSAFSRIATPLASGTRRPEDPQNEDINRRSANHLEGRCEERYAEQSSTFPVIMRRRPQATPVDINPQENAPSSFSGMRFNENSAAANNVGAANLWMGQGRGDGRGDRHGQGQGHREGGGQSQSNVMMAGQYRFSEGSMIAAGSIGSSQHIHPIIPPPCSTAAAAAPSSSSSANTSAVTYSTKSVVNSIPSSSSSSLSPRMLPKQNLPSAVMRRLNEPTQNHQPSPSNISSFSYISAGPLSVVKSNNCNTDGGGGGSGGGGSRGNGFGVQTTSTDGSEKNDNSAAAAAAATVGAVTDAVSAATAGTGTAATGVGTSGVGTTGGYSPTNRSSMIPRVASSFAAPSRRSLPHRIPPAANSVKMPSIQGRSNVGSSVVYGASPSVQQITSSSASRPQSREFIYNVPPKTAPREVLGVTKTYYPPPNVNMRNQAMSGTTTSSARTSMAIAPLSSSSATSASISPLHPNISSSGAVALPEWCTPTNSNLLSPGARNAAAMQTRAVPFITSSIYTSGGVSGEKKS